MLPLASAAAHTDALLADRQENVLRAAAKEQKPESFDSSTNKENGKTASDLLSAHSFPLFCFSTLLHY